MREANVCWVVTPGEPGMRNQALGLAEAVGLPIIEKRSFVRPPWSWLPGGLLPTPISAADPSGDPLAPPWPRLLIACGRRSIGLALAVKRLSRGQTVTAYVQNPELARRGFDLVATLPHDNVTGANVVTIDTALHHITPARLSEARSAWRSRLKRGDAPLLGVLLGGDNGSYRMTEGVIDELVETLRSAHRSHGINVFITPSRRTGEQAKGHLAGALGEEEWAAIWDEISDNPYIGVLSASDRLIVTAESISMISEALATGSPVHVLRLEGRGERHEAFLARMAAEGRISEIKGGEIDWNFVGTGPVYAAKAPAERLREMLKGRAETPR